MNTTENNFDVQPKSHGTVFIVVFVLLCLPTGLSCWIPNSHLLDDRFLGWLAMIGVSVATYSKTRPATHRKLKLNKSLTTI